MATRDTIGSYLFTGLAACMGCLLVVLYLQFLKPAHSKSMESACNTMKFQDINPVLGPLSDKPTAPDFNAKNEKGEIHSLETYKGKYLLINFWASWCATCRSEKNGLEDLYNNLKDDNLEVLTFAADEDWNKIKRATSDRTSLKIYMDPPNTDDRLGKIGKRYGITGVPETFVINPEGNIIGQVVSRRDWNSDVVKTCVRSMLSQQP